MSFSPDVFKKKLDSLQETQDSIVSISQWVLFHHRRVKELCQLWSEYTLSDDPKLNSKKKLSLLYLCNDVVQQARHKRKPEFSAEFAKCLPEVLHKVFPSMDDPIKPKIERLRDLWGSDIRNMRRAIDSSKSGKSFDAEAPVAKVQPAGPKLNSELVHLNNLYNHMTQLSDVCNSNLTQIGFQSKQYLPNDHGSQDALPSPKIYISKLNVLEKLCSVTSQNLTDIKAARKDVLSSLQNLQRLLEDGLSTDESKEQIIAQRLEKLNSTRSSLQEMLDGEGAEDEEASPAFEKDSPPPVAAPAPSNDDDALPTYDNSDSDDDDDDRDEPPAKRRKASDSSVSSNASGKKSVAFSEDIQINEYDREEQTDVIKVAKSDNESDDDTNFEPSLPENLEEYEAHHKDDLELHKIQQGGSNGTGGGSNGGDSDQNAGLLNLLSKLS
ncbi:uncharacterized protein CXQ87_003345 [Candidozyma duobushaemuli]|uniref:CID domain-containing protein n=1 Tax=Candidozyma duobushaemuli TaxID=1231522 RepID=A0A2V1AE12_9ASCO|nr:uncharacterized protein CXQ87_003345 [[Candida] duobushaemulonis]PVH15503.1 hypothetical protein CXQ87_003345 [[Candida] duobushaemulonis]